VNPTSLASEANSYLAFPNWYTARSAALYADFIQSKNPGDYPFLTSVAQYWCSYKHLAAVTSKYPKTLGPDVALLAGGTLFSLDYEIQSLYENTLGRITEWTVELPTDEDLYGAQVAKEYADFVQNQPWYQFPFASKISGVWQTSWWGPSPIRSYERKIVLTVEYLVKSVGGSLAEVVASAPRADSSVYVTAVDISDRSIAEVSGAFLQARLPGGAARIATVHSSLGDVLEALATKGAEFQDIDGNVNIALSIIVPQAWSQYFPEVHELLSLPILTDPTHRRIIFSVRVPDLAVTLTNFRAEHVPVERVYDY